MVRRREHEYLHRNIFDTNEMLSWLKRLPDGFLDIQCRNRAVVAKVKRDLERMYDMYCGDEKMSYLKRYIAAIIRWLGRFEEVEGIRLQ